MVILPFSLAFDTRHQYNFDTLGIPLDVHLVAGPNECDFLAWLDTGAPYCIFQRQYGENLGLHIENGLAENLRSSTHHPFRVFGHELVLDVLGLSFNSIVYFAEDQGFNRNVLGRRGWLDLVRIALIHYDTRLFLSPHGAV